MATSLFEALGTLGSSYGTAKQTKYLEDIQMKQFVDQLALQKSAQDIERQREKRLESQGLAYIEQAKKQQELAGFAHALVFKSSTGKWTVHNPATGQHMDLADVPADAQLILPHPSGRPAGDRDVTPDEQSITGWSRIYRDAAGEEQFRTPAPPPASTMETVHEGEAPAVIQDPNDPNKQLVLRVPTTSVTRKVPISRGAAPTARGAAPGVGTTAPAPRPGSARAIVQKSGAASAPSPKPALPAGTPPGTRFIGSKAAPGASGQAAQNREIGLRNLEISLFGNPKDEDPDMRKGLKDVMDVLDSPLSRSKIIPYIQPTNEEWTVTRIMKSLAASGLSTPEKDFIYQFRRAASAVQALRQIEGLPRSSQQLVELYMNELANPESTPSKEDGIKRIKLIERLVRQARLEKPVDPRANISIAGGAGIGGGGEETGRTVPPGEIAVKDASGNVIGHATPAQQKQNKYTPF